jgi:hypothetical protein
MKNLIEREEYIKEYLRISNYIENVENVENNDNELYESLLSTVFGGLKMLFKKDWENIKCKNPSVLSHIQEIDKSLQGYTMIKMQYYGECNTIRQNVADYYSDILDYKLLQLEKEENPDKFIEKENKEKEENKENKDINGVAKILNLKDKTLLDSLKKYKENISTACKASPKLREYADQMLNAVTVIVNDIILAELEKKGADKAKIEEERKKIEEKQKELDAVRKKMDEEAKKAGEEKLKELSKERDDAMRSLGVKPIGAMDGDKSVETIAKQFADIISEFNDGKVNESALPKGYSEILRSDVYIGIQKSLEELEWNFSENEEHLGEQVYDKFFIRVILNKINTTFEVIEKNKEMFKGVPSASVQAMMVSLSNAVIYGFMGKKFNIENNDARISLLTKCAIDSDATIGFNLPLIDSQKPDNGNFFVSIMNQFKSENISSKEVEDAVKSMTKDEIEAVEKEWGGSNGEEKDGEDSKENNNNSSDDKKEKVTADPKDQSEFAKQFGPMVMKEFRQNMTNLFDIIVKKAQEIKDKEQKDREAEAAKAQQESESEEKK